MGNDKSRPVLEKVDKLQQQRLESTPNRVAAGATFDRLCRSSAVGICQHDLQTEFGIAIGNVIWRHVALDKTHVDKDTFINGASSLITATSDTYIQLIATSEIVRICAIAADISSDDIDSRHLQVIMSDIEHSSSSADIIRWKNENCSRMCDALQAKVMRAFVNQQVPTPVLDYNSDVLSRVQMWFIQCALPTIYVDVLSARNTQTDDKMQQQQPHWTPLYSSADQGISINRFEKNTFDYRGPTITILSLNGGHVYVLALDQEWRNSAKCFGGAQSILLQLLPVYRRFDHIASTIYFNYKLRTAPFGFSIGKHLHIDKDMSNVAAIEVWGASGAATHQQQQQLKQWQGRQVEKHKQVPLPGRWEENPDRLLLEMAGVGSGDHGGREVHQRDGDP